MSRNYSVWRENISTGQIILFCSYGEKLSHLPGKVFGSYERNNERFAVMSEYIELINMP
jgi:hypothetical protein